MCRRWHFLMAHAAAAVARPRPLALRIRRAPATRVGGRLCTLGDGRAASSWTRRRVAGAPDAGRDVEIPLVAHGVGTDALKRARASYEQTWTTSESGAEGEFQVRTTSEEVGIDRTLTYSLGEFVEKYETSAIFGAEPGEVTRVASFDAATRTHTTTTTSSIGHETTTRRVREDGKEMTCERRFVSNDAEVEVDVTCVEIFVRRET